MIHFLSEIDTNFGRKLGSRDRRKRILHKTIAGGFQGLGASSIVGLGGMQLLNKVPNNRLKRIGAIGGILGTGTAIGATRGYLNSKNKY